MVDKGHEETEAEETAGCEDEEQHAVGSADEALAEEAACTESLADHAEEGECPGEAETDEESVKERVPYVVLRSEGFGATQHDAVDHDEGDEETQRGIEVGDEALHHHLDDGYEGGNDDDEAWNTYFVGYHALEKRDDDIGAHKHEGGGKTHAESVDGRCRCCQRGAHAEDEDPDGVLLDKSILDDIFSFHYSFSPFSVLNAE